MRQPINNSSRVASTEEVFIPCKVVFQLAQEEVLADLCFNHTGKLLVEVKERYNNGFKAVVVSSR